MLGVIDFVANVLGLYLVLLPCELIVLVAYPLEEVLSLVAPFGDEWFMTQFPEPVVIGGEEVESPVGKEIETAHPRLEEFCKQKVSAFVQGH